MTTPDKIPGPCMAWALAVEALGKVHGKPLPKEIVTTKCGAWQITLNFTDHTAQVAPSEPSASLPPPTAAQPGGTTTQPQPHMIELQRFGIWVEHESVFAFGILEPHGGMIGGYPEERFIADLEKELGGKTFTDGETEDGTSED